MNSNSRYFMDQADACARDAAAATLDNVRERCLRSEKSWRAMADRQLRAEGLRADQAAKKAARDEAEADA
jgi:hypothetical protein